MSDGGGFSFGDLGNLDFMNLFGKVKALKGQIEEKRAELREQTFEATSGGGIVTAVSDGEGIVRTLEIDPAAIVPSEKELLEDLIKAAVNEARQKARQKTEQEIAALTAGLPIPPGLMGLFG